MADPDYILDLSSLKSRENAPDDAPAPSTLRGRPWLAIRWKCCSTYSRIYRNAEATAYTGRCPHCRRELRVAVGEGGTSARFFEAS